MWIQAVFVAGGVIVALRAIYANRRIAEERSAHDRIVASRRAALDFIAAYEIHDSEWAKTNATALRVLENRHLWDRLFSSTPQDLQPDELELRRTALAYLNHHELVAIAVARGAIDRDMYVQWFGSSYKLYWARTSSAVKHIRDHLEPNAFTEFQAFAESIEDSPTP